MFIFPTSLKHRSLRYPSTSSNLAIIPLTVAPAYSASKAALNVFALSLRAALQDTKVKVIELSPPPVQSK